MIPGVASMAHHSLDGFPVLPENALVAITEHSSKVPYAIGRIAMSSTQLKMILTSPNEVKGKAVHVLHTYQDFLWEQGSKSEPPSHLPSLSINDPDSLPIEQTPELATTSVQAEAASAGESSQKVNEISPSSMY